MTQPPHLRTDIEPLTSRRGFFWITGDRVHTEQGTVQSGPLYVEWEAPVEVTRPYPLVLVHGGGGQSTDWKGTPDGRPGWARRFVEAGFAVYTVDRPWHGRSPHHADVAGPKGPPFSYEFAGWLFAPEGNEAHTQWTWDRDAESPELDQLVASSGALPVDLAASQAADADRLARLLDLIGPAVLVTHSAGGPAGWLTADARPGRVRGIVAVEPMGPPYFDMPGNGPITWGLSYAPLHTEPSVDDPAELGDGTPRIVPGLRDLPILVVAGSASMAAQAIEADAAFLRGLGARAEALDLADAGIVGNGHGLMFEANSDETVVPVIDWIARSAG